MKILLPIDESPYSEEAIKEVERRFATPETAVRVLHAVVKFVPPAAALVDAGGSLEEARAEVLNQYQDLVSGVAARLQARGISAEAIVLQGEPGKVIVQDAQDWEADLIVMGSHSYGPIKE